MTRTEKVTFRSMQLKKGGTGIDSKTGKTFSFSDRYAVKFDQVVDDYELLPFEINVNTEETELIEKLKNIKPLQEIMITLEGKLYKDTMKYKILDVPTIEKKKANTEEENNHRPRQTKLY